jgi:type IV pilus assembly protein PilB
MGETFSWDRVLQRQDEQTSTQTLGAGMVADALRAHALDPEPPEAPPVEAPAEPDPVAEEVYETPIEVVNVLVSHEPQGQQIDLDWTEPTVELKEEPAPAETLVSMEMPTATMEPETPIEEAVEPTLVAIAPKTPSKPGDPAGRILVSRRLISEAQLSSAVEMLDESSASLGSVLISCGFITEELLVKALAAHMGVPAWDLEKDPPAAAAVSKLSADLCRAHSALPVQVRGDLLLVAMADPGDLSAVEKIRKAAGMRIEPVLAFDQRLERAIEEAHGVLKHGESLKAHVSKAMANVERPSDALHEQHQLTSDEEERPIVTLVNQILKDAIRLRASDVHIEPRTGHVDIRYRVDGQLQKVREIPSSLLAMLTTRLKIMAELDIVESRMPQDGRVAVNIDGRLVDLRVSVLPNHHGQRIVLRILDKTVALKKLVEIGFSDENLDLFRTLIQKPYGMLLVTGPTGSGKTTTLYAALEELREVTSNIMTCEDPIEYDIQGINQSQVNEKVGLTFPAQLRAILRQDPDIILVGEIRDGETAQTAIRAAMTGHLVLSTLHCNDAPSAVPRLFDMGADPFLLSTSLVGVMSQRLVRILCPACKESRPTSDEELKLIDSIHLGASSGARTVCVPKGCPQCDNTGYRGRTAVHEIMPVMPDVARAISTREPMEVVRSLAARHGYRPMQESALKLVLEGQTSLAEARRYVAFQWQAPATGHLRAA